jgi:hypothetical protein
VNLQSIGFTGAQQLVANNATYSLSTPAVINQRSVFRRVFGLRINTGGLADSIRFDRAAAHLSIEFSARQFDIAGTSGVQVHTKGQALTIELPVPLQIRRARLRGGSASTVEIYRLDGDEVAGDPTKSIT